MEPPSLGCFALLPVILTMRMVRSVGAGEVQSPQHGASLLAGLICLSSAPGWGGGCRRLSLALKSAWVGEGWREPPSGLAQLSLSLGVVTGPCFFQPFSNWICPQSLGELGEAQIAGPHPWSFSMWRWNSLGGAWEFSLLTEFPGDADTAVLKIALWGPLNFLYCSCC